jgi:hypothetical protein
VYHANRPWRDEQPANSTEANDPFAGYRGALDAGMSLGGLRGWWRHQDHLRTTEHNTLVLDAVDSAVTRAIRVLKGGLSPDLDIPTDRTPFYDPLEEDVLFEVPGRGWLALSELSDGYRGVLGMVADIARRVAQLDPEPTEDLLDHAVGVVVIDEVDLHLHPGWQLTVLPCLRSTFKNLQFIVTTHSDQVLTSTEADCVRYLDADGGVSRVTVSEGLDSNTALRDLMGAPVRLPKYKEKLDAVARFVEEGKYDDARALLDELAGKLGVDDPNITALEWDLADAQSLASEEP